MVKGFMVCRSAVRMPGDWRRVYVVFVYEGKRENKECISCMDIRLLNVSGKMFSKCNY